MKVVLMTVGLIWGGSLLAIGLGILGMWISSVGGRLAPRSKRRRGARGGALRAEDVPA